MNNSLKKEIINHIFEITGLLQSGNNIKILDNLLSDKFLTNKKIAFQTDDEKKFSSNIWAATATVEQSIIKLVVANLSDTIEEYVLLIQMDTFPPYCLQLSKDAEDNGTFVFCVDNTWIEAGTLIQANVLAGIESISDLLVKWQPFKECEKEYTFMLSFLNFKEELC